MRDEEVPRHHKRAVKKRFGIAYEFTHILIKTIYTRYHWYATEKARDQAYIDLPKHTWTLLKGRERQFRKVER
jgi:hypothetical protein